MIDLDADAEWIVLLTDELTGKRQRDGNMLIELPPLVVVQLAGLIQLALKRPDVTPPIETTGGAILAMVDTYFADCPTVLATLAASADPVTGDAKPLHRRTQTRH